MSLNLARPLCDTFCTQRLFAYIDLAKNEYRVSLIYLNWASCDEIFHFKNMIIIVKNYIKTAMNTKKGFVMGCVLKVLLVVAMV